MPGPSVIGYSSQALIVPLLKLNDNGPATGILKTVTDGMGNDTALRLCYNILAVNGTFGWEDTPGVMGPTLQRDVDGVFVANREIRMNGSGTGALFGVRNTSSAANGFSTDVPGDTNNRFTIQVSGRMDWGPGSGAQDCTLQRTGALAMSWVANPTITGNLTVTGYIATATTLQANVSAFSIGALIAGNATGGAVYGCRIVPGTTGTLIDGMDYTGVTSYQPLYVGGSLLNLTVSGTTKATLLAAGLSVVNGFGCNGAAAQSAVSSGGALAAYGAGANGFDTAAHASSLYAMVVAIRAALVANGIMS